jgi:hypothetical protein
MSREIRAYPSYPRQCAKPLSIGRALHLKPRIVLLAGSWPNLLQRRCPTAPPEVRYLALELSLFDVSP